MDDESIYFLVAVSLLYQLFDQVAQTTPEATPFAERIGFNALSAPDAPKVGWQCLE
jgi:hypothetical protein